MMMYHLEPQSTTDYWCKQQIDYLIFPFVKVNRACFFTKNSLSNENPFSLQDYKTNGILAPNRDHCFWHGDKQYSYSYTAIVCIKRWCFNVCFTFYVISVTTNLMLKQINYCIYLHVLKLAAAKTCCLNQINLKLSVFTSPSTITCLALAVLLWFVPFT